MTLDTFMNEVLPFLGIAVLAICVAFAIRDVITYNIADRRRSRRLRRRRR